MTTPLLVELLLVDRFEILRLIVPTFFFYFFLKSSKEEGIRKNGEPGP